jgi:hypothetical protein
MNNKKNKGGRRIESSASAAKSRQYTRPEYRPDSATYLDRSAVLRQIGFNSYADYLASELWAKIRIKVFATHDGKCRLCDRKATEVHHFRYSKSVLLGKSFGMNLVPLCRLCHEKVEVDDTGKKRTLRQSQIAFIGFLNQLPENKDNPYWTSNRVVTGHANPNRRCLGCDYICKRRKLYCRKCAKLVIAGQALPAPRIFMTLNEYFERARLKWDGTRFVQVKGNESLKSFGVVTRNLCSKCGQPSRKGKKHCRPCSKTL